VRTFWLALREELATAQTFDAVMAEVWRNVRTLHATAVRANENDSPDCWAE
jgi:hypothetical protein